MSAQLWLVKEAVGIVIGDETPVAAFSSFFDASDYVGEHPEQRLYIEPWDGFIPVLTNEDLDAYASRSDKPGGKDPRDGFDEWELSSVLMFLAWAAQLKAMEAPEGDPGQFGYERMLYAYSEIAEGI